MKRRRRPSRLAFGAGLVLLQWLGIFTVGGVGAIEPTAPLLRAEDCKPYIDGFNHGDQELYRQHIPNAHAWAFLRDNIPLLACPDPDIERTYYFRWWAFRKHIKQTPDGYVITEFLPPVGWAGKHNTISSYLYGDAVAIANLAALTGRKDVEKGFREKAQRLKAWKNGTWDPAKGGVERGKDYNHSTYCDLIINGLIGLRPRADDIVEVNPLVPANTWDWFCLDNVLYHGRKLTIVWDKTGEKYGRGKGLRVLADGQEIARADSIGRITGTLPSLSAGTAAGWRKHSGNPVLGGDLGTCFDVTLLKQADTYRMWSSWRPRKSVALVESPDGIHWTEPRLVLGPNPNTGWEGDINRPSVLKREDGCHLWYTGQSRRQSWIGYATSPDGLRWMKYEANPVFTADPSNPGERHKVTACQVIQLGDGHLMFYIGFRNEHLAQIGLARSREGVTGWERHLAKPIIFPSERTWDGDACYKPFAILDEDQHRWLLWYNGRKGSIEQIGMAVHPGADLGFPGP